MELYEPLMLEHRLIERFFKVVENQIKNIEKTNKVDTAFVNTLSDFFITYVDIYHHGKEENILFQKLEKKKLTLEHKKMMKVLLDEHKLGRRVVEELIKSTSAYANGDENEVQNIIARFKDFIKLYQEHIIKEDKYFFIPCMDYLTSQEKEDLMQDFWRYTIKLIDKKYEQIVEMLEQ